MKRFLIILMMAIMSFSVGSCDLINDLGSLTDDQQQELETDGYVEGWTEEGDKLIFKMVAGESSYQMTYLFTFEFKGDTCEKAELQIIFPDALTATIFHAALESEGETNAKLSGKKVIVDYTAEYKGLSKSELKAAIEATDSWM